MDGRPAPIEPDGLLDGIRWSAVVRGAILDNVLTLVASIPLMLFFVGTGALAEDEAAAERSFEQAFSSLEFLLAFFVIGMAITVYAGFWAARRAGVLPLRHGGWTAVVSLAIATLFLLLPGASEGSATPIWYDAISFALMLPAGVLGGWLASRVPPSHPGPR
jgi:hypothetical protein